MSKIVEPADALLAVDIGNSRIGLGVWDDDGLHDSRQLRIDKAGSWNAVLEEIWESMSDAKRQAIIVGSVNPPIARQFSDLATKICDCEPLLVRDDIPFPIELEIDNPREVGVDRICSAAAAFERLQEPCAIASFGTAITMDCVSAEGRFLGGTITPGLETSCEALHAHTAKLPRVSPAAPTSVFARNTYDAIVNGVLFAAVGALRETVEKFATELNQWPKLVITGGHAPLIIEAADFVDAYVPDLCLQGVALAYRKAAEQT